VEVEAETIPVVKLLEVSLEQHTVLHAEISTSSSAPEPEATIEVEAVPVEFLEPMEEELITEVLASKHVEHTNAVKDAYMDWPEALQTRVFTCCLLGQKERISKCSGWPILIS